MADDIPPPRHAERRGVQIGERAPEAAPAGPRRACVAAGIVADASHGDFLAGLAGNEKLLKAIVQSANGRGVLNIGPGGANAALAEQLNAQGVKAIALPAAGDPQPRPLACDLAHYDPDRANATREALADAFGRDWLVACFDVAHRIDREHIADFLLNLSALAGRTVLVSVSTAPGDTAAAHPTLIPLNAWAELFRLAGFDARPHDALNALRTPSRAARTSDAGLAAAHWRRINPFRDRASHNHVLLLRRMSARPCDADAFRAAVEALLDIAYRRAKRRQVEGEDLPVLVYGVSFIQDWWFARSLMDVWPADRLRLLFRSDCIAPPYLSLLLGHAARVGVQHEAIRTVAEGAAALDRWDVDKAMYVTASEGVQSVSHLMNSLLTIEARKRGARTVCLQHGMNIGRTMTPASTLFAAWDEGSARALEAHWEDRSQPIVACAGSVKFNDALLPATPGGIARRLGDWALDFQRTILIGLNLHWQVHRHGPDETMAWIERLSEANPDTLFLLRPHPDDPTAYDHADRLDRPNLAVIDELTLLNLDTPISRILRDVDGVISTQSTLAIDALAAGRPVALLPSQGGWREPGEAFLPVSTPLEAGQDLPIVSDEEWASGALPEALTEGRPARIAEDWFEPSRSSLRRFVALPKAAKAAAFRLSSPDPHVMAALQAACRDFDLGANPHRDQARIAEAVERFVARASGHMEADDGLRIPSPPSRKLSLPPDYVSRDRPEYHHEDVVHDSGVIWQPEVYELAAAIAAMRNYHTVVDIGCGNAEKLVKIPVERVVGIDFGPNMDWCRQHHSRGEWIECDLEQPDLEALRPLFGPGTVVVCSDVVEHLVNPLPLIGLWRAAWSAGSVVITSTPDRVRVRGKAHRGPPGNPAHVREWQLDEYLALLDSQDFPATAAGLTIDNDRDHQLVTIVTVHDGSAPPNAAAGAGARIDFAELRPWIEGLKAANAMMRNLAAFTFLENTGKMVEPEPGDRGGQKPMGYNDQLDPGGDARHAPAGAMASPLMDRFILLAAEAAAGQVKHRAALREIDALQQQNSEASARIRDLEAKLHGRPVEPQNEAALAALQQENAAAMARIGELETMLNGRPAGMQHPEAGGAAIIALEQQNAAAAARIGELEAVLSGQLAEQQKTSDAEAAVLALQGQVEELTRQLQLVSGESAQRAAEALESSALLQAMTQDMTALRQELEMEKIRARRNAMKAAACVEENAVLRDSIWRLQNASPELVRYQEVNGDIPWKVVKVYRAVRRVVPRPIVHLIAMTVKAPKQNA